MGKIEITPELIAELKKKAQAATPGPWSSMNDPADDFDFDTAFITTKKRHKESRVAIAEVGFVDADNEFGDEQRANARYIAAVFPDVVLALLEHMERLEKEAQWLAEFCEGEEQCPYLAFQWGETNSMPKWCTALDTIEDGFECEEYSVDCWRRIAREIAEGNNGQD